MPVIELDMLIAFVNKADKLHDVAVKIFNKIINKELRNVAIPVSAFMEYELVLRSRGYGEDTICSDIEAFKSIENIDEITLTSNIIIKASSLRKRYGLTYFDSLHVASALLYDKLIISTDKAYQKISGLKILDPKQITSKSRNSY